MREVILFILISLVIVMTTLTTPVLSSCHRPTKPMYSVYIIWDNQIIQNDTTSYVDSTQYVFDDDTKLLVNRIQ
jgi:hypothetical protein